MSPVKIVTPPKSQKHALCAPSAAERWLACPGSIAMEAGEPEVESEYAAEGTRAHELAAHVLKYGWSAEAPASDPDMRANVSLYIDRVNGRIEDYRRAGAKVIASVEVELALDALTGEKGAVGTSDAVIIAEFADHSVLEVDDLKYGRGVEVSVVNNPQLMLYAAAAMQKFQLLHNFTQIVMRIHQPRINPDPQEVQIPVAELLAFVADMRPRAALALQIVKDGPAAASGHLVPGDVQCRFCRAKARCPALAQMVHNTVFGEFVSLDSPEVVPELEVSSAEENTKRLPLYMTRVPLIEDWCKSIRAKVEETLMAGKPIAGYKLVEGRKGARAWTDTDAAEKVLMHAGIETSLILAPAELLSPTQVEKNIAKAHPTAWTSVADLIRQAEGKPSVAPESDRRPPWSPRTKDDFDTHDAADLV